MSFLFTQLLLLIFAACVGFLITEGTWGNAITLINVVTAALVATNFFEPLAKFLEGIDSNVASFTYFLDFLSLWGLFTVSLVILKLLTAYASNVKVRFMGIVDRVGGVFFAVWIGWVMVCFTTMTLHTAPLAEKFMNGGFNYEERMFMGLAPDRQWLSFANRVSGGPFSRGDGKLSTFDPSGEFISKYAARRKAFDELVMGTGSLRVDGSVPKR